jgi:signal transduction histidine kinase
LSDSVLYIEDDTAQARLVQNHLERAGCTVELASDGVQGLACYAAKSYAVVIVDQTMPGLSGLEVIRAMAARGPLPPTIMVTGTGNEQIAVEAMKLGVTDYLIKDLEGGFMNVLPLVVRRVIQQRQTLVEKRRIERELAQDQKLKAIGQLAAGIAHEINTPNQYIGDNTRFLQDAFRHISALLDAYDRLLDAARQDSVTDELLAEVETKVRGADLGYLNAEIPQALEQSLEGVEHVAHIVGAMQEFSHPDAVRIQAVDLNHVIKSAITLCRNEWKYVAEVATDFTAELPAVRCLPSDIHRVVVNLMVNAAHAIAAAAPDVANGRRNITVSTRRNGPWAEIRVEDTGTGIPAEIRDRIFEPFFTTKDVGEGTGQGLAIARAIVVEKHGGTIHFETEAGQGTTFVVRLPIDGCPDAQAAAAPQSLAASNAS